MAHSDHSEYREELTAEHPHSFDHTEPQYSIIAILGIVCAISLVVVGVGIQVYYQSTENNLVYDRVLSQPSWTLQDLRNKENWELTHYQYVDKNKGVVRIPIDEAMKLVAQEAAENRPKYPVTPYKVKTAADLAAAPAVSPAGAAAVNADQKSGIKSSPNVQQPAPQQPHQ